MKTKNILKKDAADAAKLAEYRADMKAFMAKQKEEEAL
jgi:hypothetical protein